MIYFKDAADILATKVTKLFVKIYEEKKIPEQWKIGKITPIPKKGHSNEASNFRPITSLCSLAKTFEKCILHRLNSLGDFTGESQHGFKKGHSTVTTLLQLQHEIAENINQGLYHAVLSIDLSAAFDTVNPDLLLKRMSICGIPNDITDLLRDWLKDRKAYVEIGGESSEFFDVPEGTVQGSVLGPVLFAIFIAPMFDIIKATSYADDSYLSEFDQSLGELKRKIQNSANKLTKWFKSSGLVVNEQKTEFCIFHKTQKVTCEITVGTTRINSQMYMKALGVFIDVNLKWENHINYVSKQCDKINMGFRILKKYFNQNELLQLATSLYYSKLYYASEVWLWPNMPTGLLKILTSTSSKILKTITGIKCDQTDHISFYELHKRTNRATPKMMSLYTQATAMHRIISNQTPMVIFTDLALHHVDSTRHYKPTFVKSSWNRSGDNIFRNRVQKMCNELQTDMTTLSYERLKIVAKRNFLRF